MLLSLSQAVGVWCAVITLTGSRSVVCCYQSTSEMSSCSFPFQAIQQGHLKCNLKGVALGDSWISPVGKLWYIGRLEDEAIVQYEPLHCMHG